MTIFRVTVRMNSSLAGMPAFNVWHLRTADGAVGDSQLDSALTALKTFYTGAKAYMPTGVTVTCPYDVVKHGSGYGPGVPGQDEYVDFTPATQTGTGLSTYAPQPIAAVVGWHTSIRARTGTGRTFIGPLATNIMDSVDGTLTANGIAALKTAAEALIAAGAGPDAWSWGVYSRKENVIRDFRTATVADRCAVLRSRRG